MHSFAPFWNPLHRSEISIFSSKIAKTLSRLNNWISDCFHFLRRILHFFCEFLWIFVRISRQILEKSDVCRFTIKFAKTNSKIAEYSEICENYSISFNIIHSCPYFWPGGRRASLRRRGRGSARLPVLGARLGVELRQRLARLGIKPEGRIEKWIEWWIIYSVSKMSGSFRETW